MTNPRKVGIMVDSSAIESNLTHMTDALRNANYKVLDASGVKPNEDGEYIDKDGDNLLMEEGVVKALLQDALDSYIVATLPGRNKTDPNEFTYYLWDSFPNIAEYIQAEPRISSYVSTLFANTCGLMIGALAPAIQDITAHGQSLESIETFQHDTGTNYYVLVGEDDPAVDTDPDHNYQKMSAAERQERKKIDLIRELGVEGYEAHIRKEQQVRDNENLPSEVVASLSDYDSRLKDAEAFTDYVNVLTSLPVDGVFKHSDLIPGFSKRVARTMIEQGRGIFPNTGIGQYYKESIVDAPDTTQSAPNEPISFF